jgi:holo-[acyl-carrier protein] synthase
MIFGIGVDVLEAKRMQASYARFGARLLERLLLPAERQQFERTRRPERFLAMRFAAKEAIVKAMGTGFAHGVWIRDIGEVQNAWGKPEVIYSARGERVRRRLGVGEGHVTLTDEAGLIVAVAVLLRATVRRAGRRAPAKRAPAKRVKPKRVKAERARAKRAARR